MVGGYVIHIFRVRKRFDGKIRWALSVLCADRYGDGCAVYVDEACPVQVGDQIWWQGRKAMWTPKDKSREDVQFARYGYSFDPTQETPHARD